MAKDSNLRIQTFSDWERTAILRPQWEELLAASSAKTIFLTHEWLGSWWQAYGENKELLVIVIRDAKDQLIAIAPLFIENRKLAGKIPARVINLVGDRTTDSGYLNFLIRAGWESICANAIFDYLLTHPSWNILELNALSAQSPVTNAVIQQLSKTSWRALSESVPRSAICLPDTWENYLKTLSPGMRYSIVSKTRRLIASCKVTFRLCDHSSLLPDDLEFLFIMHNDRWQKAGVQGAFHSKDRREFYQQFAEKFLMKGYLHFWFLELDGKPAAAEFGFRFEETYSRLQAGFDPTYKQLGVGEVLRAHVIRNLIADQVRTYEFLAGDEEFKVRSGAEKSSAINLRCARSRSMGAVYLEMIRAKRIARKRWPEKI